MYPLIGVLADDLTGALASAGRLRDGGLRPVVQWRTERVPALATAVVADMRTRDYRSDPRLRARSWAAHLRAQGCARLELRTDSTLRGAPADELDGALSGWAMPDPWVLAVPAFPEAARYVVDGRLVLADPATPGHGTDIAQILFPGAAVHHLPVSFADRGAAAVADAIRESAASGARRFLADATTEDHLRALAEAAGSLVDRDVLLVTASPGAWLRYIGMPPGGARYLLVVLSSATRTNHDQLAELRRRRATVVLNARALVAGESRMEWPQAPRGSPVVVVETLSAPARDTAEAWLLASVAVRAAGYVLEDGLDSGCRCAGIVVSGGQTASALMDVLDARRLDPSGELAPLCPYARLRGGTWTGLRVVTKGGLVGTTETLARLVDALWREPSDHTAHWPDDG
ncbi:MAG: hypothetical protein GEV03_21760 [Streptosporangiales bacterium]|nr:hypothetical protein [Streptosporangiales bacterium]